MLHNHQNGVTLTLEFATVGDIAYFQEGLADLLSQVAEAADEMPATGASLGVLARLVKATTFTEQQTTELRKGLLKIGKLPEDGPISTAA